MTEYGNKTGLPKSIALVIVVAVIVMAIGYFVTHIPSASVKTSGGMMGGGGSSGSNVQPVIGAATPHPSPSATAGTATPTEGKEKAEIETATAYYAELKKYENIRSVVTTKPALMIPMANLASMKEIPVYNAVQSGGETEYYITNTEMGTDKIFLTVEDRGEINVAQGITVALFTSDYKSGTFEGLPTEGTSAKKYKVELSSRTLYPNYFPGFKEMLANTKYIVFALR